MIPTLDQIDQAGIGLDRREFQLGFKLTCPHCGRELSYTPRDLRKHFRFREANLVQCRATAECGLPFPVSVVRKPGDWHEVHQWGMRHDGAGGRLEFYPPHEASTWGPRG